ncbi:ATP-binding protein [Rhodobacter sp. NSM]|uniref:ATP-binding protein n=1 Tax=Rhodobacter sp. NSM TaxID=3457501 RepID=UPI003FD66B11
MPRPTFASFRRSSGSLLPAALLLAGTLALAAATYFGVRFAGLSALDADLRDRLTVARHAVVAEVERFRYLPGLVGQDARVLALLSGAAPSEAANVYLRRVRELSGVDEIYVIDPTGDTVAASNWNEPGSFLGQNYGFRPYFRRALEEGEARYYAVGVTTGKPGYFLASRLGPPERPLGVAVAKVDLAGLQSTWVRAGEAVALADPLGVVFLAGPQGWLYRPLAPLSEEDRALLRAERRYAGLSAEGAEPLLSAMTTDAGEELRMADAVIAPDDWRLLVGLPVAPAIATARLSALIVALAGFLASAGLMAWNERRQLLRERLNQHALLERAVAERTEALAHEIEERRRAERELRETHEHLVHAAKLAVLGRMSSTIVHEVSQPLSALEATLAAAELHLGREDRERTMRSVRSGRDLLVRMQKMVKALKSFGSRQRLDPPEAVEMGAVVAAAAEVLAPRLRELGVRLDLPPAGALPAVRGHAVRLEQVATNLILNAAEATASGGGSDPVEVRLDPVDGGLRLTIADRGPGIPEALRDKILEPFFTTRTTGLGLGLSIVRTMLDQMAGHLSFAARPGGGTITRVDLALYEPGREALRRRA